MRKRRAVLAAALALAAIVALGGPAARAEDEHADLLLVLAADISRSVDERKFKLQRDGYANALTDPRVVRAMTAGPKARIALTSWNGPPTATRWWWSIGPRRQPRGGGGRGQARTRGAARVHGPHLDQHRHRLLGMALLTRSPYQAPRRVIDVSGDGTHNSGRPVTQARDEAVAEGVTINGLVILSEVPLPTNPLHTHPPGGLTAYYETNVIGGPGAFVVEAESFEAFGQLADLQADQGDRRGDGPAPGLRGGNLATDVDARRRAGGASSTRRGHDVTRRWGPRPGGPGGRCGRGAS